jgi:GNAT superfamily N-acetyltransferase
MANVRSANEGDAEAVQRLRGLLGDVTHVFPLNPLEDLVADVEGDVVGWIRVTCGETLQEIGQRGAWIQSLAVLPSCRRSGIGTDLVQAAEKRAFEWGDAVIACQPLDDSSEALFQRLGFRDRTPPGRRRSG